MSVQQRPGAAVVILAAGAGSRAGGPVNKVLLPLAGVPVVAWSVRDALATPGVVRVLVVVRAGEEAELAEALDPHVDRARVDVVVGGETRHASEERALAVLGPDVAEGRLDVVAMHDGARPLAGVDLFGRVLAAARRYGGAVPVLPVTGIVTGEGDPVTGTPAGMQTPQAFRADAVVAAYRAASAAGDTATDTAGTVAAHGPGGVRVVAVTGSARNLKITWPGDLDAASRLV